jgi:hypothetical protein
VVIGYIFLFKGSPGPPGRAGTQAVSVSLTPSYVCPSPTVGAHRWVLLLRLVTTLLSLMRSKSHVSSSLVGSAP